MVPTLSAPQSARAIGLCCWMEQQVFALLGSWITEVVESGPKLVMLELSDHAAWRAQRWYELLPTAPPGADALVMGTDEFVALLSTARTISASASSIGRFVVAESLLALLAGTVADLAGRTTELAGAAVLRIAGILATDLATDLDRCRLAMSGLTAVPDVDLLTVLADGLVPFEAGSALEFLDRT